MRDRPAASGVAPPGTPPHFPMSKRTKNTDPLASAKGREWLAKQIAEAEQIEKFGPGGTGWRHNETLRADHEEGLAFLKALVALLPK